MQNGIEVTNTTDAQGNPTGGGFTGTGIDVQWQNGPLGRGAKRKEPNGAFVEDVLEGCRQRLAFFQEAADGKFACQSNALAIQCIQSALDQLESRTSDREARKVEGTHKA